jgi:hypothetical protein
MKHWRCGQDSGGRTATPLILIAAVLVPGGCFADRERPDPFEPVGSPILTASILAPSTGATVPTGQDITTRVEARDQGSLRLQGAGFVARSVTSGGQLVDSAAVRFAARGDTTHVFTFQVPNTFATNTQVDVYAIAFGPGGASVLSEPVHLVVVQCPNGTCQ